MKTASLMFSGTPCTYNGDYIIKKVNGAIILSEDRQTLPNLPFYSVFPKPSPFFLPFHGSDGSVPT